MANSLYTTFLQLFNKQCDDIQALLTQAASNDNSCAVALDAVTAVIHHKSRMDEATVAFFKSKGWLDEKGFSRSCYDEAMLKELCSHLPDACKRVPALWCEKEPTVWCYRPKYEQDKWKKLDDRCGIVATVELSRFTHDDIARAETTLRDLIRSAKEIPSLKPHALIWLAQAPQSLGLERLARHYFDDYRLVANSGYQRVVAFHSSLGKLDMRTFICTPAQGGKRS